MSVPFCIATSSQTLPVLPPLPEQVLAGKIPAWDLSDLVRRPCPACLNEDNVAVCQRPDQLIVSKCTRCEMVYLPMIPSNVQLRAFYSAYASYKAFSLPSPLYRLFTFNSPSPYLRILLSTGGVQGNRICEIGCSYGHFLVLCRHRGASVFGVEWDEEAVKYLCNRKIATAAELPQHTNFDVVCAFQLIEHLADPRNFFRKVSSSLVHDGRLLLSFPNGGEIGTIGPTWLGFRVDLEHLNYFSLFSLSNLLRDCGLYVEHYWEYGQPGVSRPQQHSLYTKFRTLLNKVDSEGPPRFSEGRFVLSVLARKL